MKSCLKTPSLPGSPDPNNIGGPYRKCVAFNAAGSEEIHWADEWDRTPTEPAKKLSYQELLELKEIQQSLPHAPQPLDPLRPAKQLLSGVPIGLLPLASVETATSPVSPPPQSPEVVPRHTFVMPPGRVRNTATPRMASSSLTHLRPPAPPPPRIKPAFSFLPLLSTPSPPVTNGVPPPDPGSYFPEYPPARSAADGEPDRVLPTPTRSCAIPISGTARTQHPVGGYEHAYRAAEAAAYSPPFGSSAYDYARDRHDMLDNSARAAVMGGGSASISPSIKTGGGKKKKKTFMFINDEQVEIEEDDDDEEEVQVLPRLALPPAAKPVPASPPSIKCESEEKHAYAPPPIPLPSPSLSDLSISPSASAPSLSTSPTTQTSLRLAGRPLSPVTARPLSPVTTTAAPLSPAVAAGRLSPVQARASSRLVRA